MLSRFDDRMESFPHTDDGDCVCDDCMKADMAPRQTPCEDCKGHGTIYEHVEGGFLDKCTCMTCLGTGTVKEEM